VRNGGFPVVELLKDFLFEESNKVACLENLTPPFEAFSLRKTSSHTLTNWLAMARISRLV
jgi:hypothetical protein